MKFLLLTVLLPVLALSAVVPQQKTVEEDNLGNILTDKLVESIRKDVQEKLFQHRMNEVVKKMKFRQAILEQAAAQKPGLHFLCKPCKTVFQDVKEELEDVEKISEPLLKEAIDNACKKYTGSIPFVEKACEKIGETAVDDIVDWLDKEEEKIVPERVCTFLHAC